MSISFELLDNILNVIKATPLSYDQGMEDTLTWAFSKNGNFSLKTACLLAKGLNPLNLITKSIAWVWKTELPPKIQFFLWLCLHNSLPTTEVLGSRGLSLNPTCNMRQGGTESIDHLLRECLVAQKI